MRRAEDSRFRPIGQAVHKLIVIPGGLDGVADAYLWEMEIPPLVQDDPSVIGLRCYKGDALYTICANGLLEEVRA